MLVPDLLTRTLEDLSNADFEKFKWYLTLDIVDGCKKIARCRLEKTSQWETVTSMIDSYGEESAVTVTVEVLKKMNMNNAAETLQTTYAEGKTAATSTSSSSSTASAPPSAPATILAQHGGVVIAPTITGSTSGSLNITVNKA